MGRGFWAHSVFGRLVLRGPAPPAMWFGLESLGNFGFKRARLQVISVIEGMAAVFMGLAAKQTKV